MRVAIIGSRGLEISDFENYLPEDTELIISGGAKGVDMSAHRYARENGIRYLEFLPEYEKYGRAAPLKRNIKIIRNADMVLAFWDGKSPGTAHTIQKCKELGVPCRCILKNDPPVK